MRLIGYKIPFYFTLLRARTSFTYLSLKKGERDGSCWCCWSAFNLSFYIEDRLVDIHILRYYGFNAMHMVVTRPHLLMGMYNIYSWIYTYTNRQIHMHLNALIYKHVNVHVRIYVYEYVSTYIGVNIYVYIFFFSLFFHWHV